ncbi:MAG: tetratricopeptide repeat protein [Acidobacteriaceae bacterium]
MPTEATSVSPTTEEIRAQLARILGSHIFAGAQRSQRFLKYVVEKSFDPGSDALKEYTIAVDVFERDASYDSSIDATVRVEAGRLRSRLHEYYAEDGKDDPLIIDVPKGGYRATVTKRPLAATTTDVARPSPAVPFAVLASPAARRRRGVWIAAACILFLIASIAGGVVLRQQRRAAASAMRTPIAMAILPFANQTGVAGNGYLSEGLTQNLIRQCSEIPRLKVMSRGAVDRVNRSSAAKVLGVTILLTGALRKNADGDLVVDAELSNVKDGSVLRSHQYLAEQSDLQPVQADIVQDVIEGLGMELDARESAHTKRPLTSSPAAFDAFLQGESAARAASPDGYHLAIQSNEQAVSKDPGFALAWEALAESHLALGIYFEPAREHMPLARKYAERALSIDSSLSQAHGTLGLIHLVYDWDYAAAQAELAVADSRESAITSLACTVHLLDQSGRRRHAEEDIRQMLEFDPRSPALIGELGCINYYGGKYEEAIRYYRQAVAADSGSPVASWGLGKSLVRERRYAEALDTLRRFKAANGFEPPVITAEIGYAEGASGDRKAAIATAHSLERASAHTFVDPYLVALIYLSLKDADNTYAWLNRAYADRSPFLISIASDPKWAGSRQDARFQELLGRMTDHARQ